MSGICIPGHSNSSPGLYGLPGGVTSTRWCALSAARRITFVYSGILDLFAANEEKKPNKNKSPLYKISKEHADVPRTRHLMGINYACLRARRRHRALFKINTASGCVRREVGNGELRPSLPDQRPRRAGLKLASAFLRCRSSAHTVEKGAQEREKRKKKTPVGAL